jgi:diguanylate cyclase (GGDEF)-like protein/PAS domain S-box-containing protein
MNDFAKYPILDNVEVPPAMLEIWQRLLDLMAEVFRVPAALIMRVHTKEIEVFLRSTNPEDVYERGERADLDSGLYCETVMSSRHMLLVPNATTDPQWDHNPDIKLGMIAYLGFPLYWPTGQVFGTMCVLDRKENHFSETYVRLLEQLKNIVEHDLQLLDADLRLRESEVRYRTMFNSVLDGIFVCHRDGRIADTNQVARHQLGFEASEFTGLRITDVLDMDQEWTKDVLPHVYSAGVYRTEGEQVHKDGSRSPVDLQVVLMTLGDEEMFVTVAHDITSRKALERELDRLASTDNLTGIGNRGGFERALSHEMKLANRYDQPLAMAMLDLDHFKQVNDRHGHEAGDRALQHVCSITASLLREADQFFRYGGEEFIVLMPQTQLDGAIHLAERIRRAVATSPLADVGVTLTVSIGVTAYQKNESRNSLVSRVDSALYAAKSAGRNAVSAV